MIEVKNLTKRYGDFVAVRDVSFKADQGSILGFLGLGAQPPTPEWGTMISDGQSYILSSWWIATLPGLAIVFVGVAFSLIGDGLADVLRPGDR